MASMDFDATIQNDGGDFRTLPEGIYPFTVKSFEKGRHNGTKKFAPGNLVKLTLRAGVAPDASDVTSTLYLDTEAEWKLCQFFLAIGMRKHGEALKMDWDATVGKTGLVELEHYSYVDNGDEKTINSVVRYLDPEEAPADGKPVAKAKQSADAEESWV